MSNKNLITTNFKTNKAEQDYYSPVSTLNNQAVTTMYAFLSKIAPWGGDPEFPAQDQKYIKNVFKNIFVVKKLITSDINPVIQRFDWSSGTVYDYYQDDIDMFETDQNDFLIFQFYVRNRYDQVFKCLWNNSNAPALNEPFFQPGSYGTNNIYVGTDGYKWKYMYTIDIGSKRTFMDANWMPVPATIIKPDPYLVGPGSGDIEVINITNPGSGYDAVNSFIQVTVTGDGTTTATGNVLLLNGSVKDVIMANTGQNYTTATVSITAFTSANLAQISGFGTGASAISPVSPIGGHGSDTISELGCSHVMYSMEFNGSEGGFVPTDVTYYQVGLIANPVSISSYPNPANGTIYKVSTDIVVATGFGSFISGETVVQQTQAGQVYFSATVLSFNSTTSVVSVINITGTPNINATLQGSISSTTRTVLSVNIPDFIPMSGYLSYIENRDGIQRSSDGIEQLRFILAY